MRNQSMAALQARLQTVEAVLAAVLNSLPLPQAAAISDSVREHLRDLTTAGTLEAAVDEAVSNPAATMLSTLGSGTRWHADYSSWVVGKH